MQLRLIGNVHQCSQGQSDGAHSQHAPQHHSPGSSQRQTRSMTRDYEAQDANAEACHVRNAYIRRPNSAGTPTEPMMANHRTKPKKTTKASREITSIYPAGDCTAAQANSH
jgi:hypothetical protein